MQQHQRKSIQMLCNGMSLTSRYDLLKEGKFPFLQNVRIFSIGEIRSRPFLSLVTTCNPLTTDLVHTIKTIIDKSTGTFTRIVGAGTQLYAGNPTPVSIATGFIGTKPFCIIDFRPTESISPYAYVACENKMVKVSSSNVLSPFGLTSPKTPPTIAIDKPSRKILDLFDGTTVPNWSILLGSAGAATVQSRINTTISAILFDDNVAPSFASIIPVTFTPSIQEGAIVSISGTEDAIISEVKKAVVLSGVTTISKIAYDSGTTGLCTITLSTGVSDLEVNSILKLGTEFIRVREVIESLTNTTTFRTSTISNYLAGQAIESYASFRAFLNLNHVVTDTLIADALKTVIAASGISGISRTFNIDLTFADTRALTDEDVFHLSLIVSDPSKITEIQIQLGLDTTTFTDNYYYKAISPNFLTASANQTSPTIAVQQQAVQRNEIIDNYEEFYRNNFRQGLFQRLNERDDYGQSGIDTDYTNPIFWRGGVSPIINSTNETSLGQNQWTEAFIKLKEFIRVGSDSSKGLKDVNKVRITVNCSAAVDLWLDSMWVGGGFNLSNLTTDRKVNPYTWVYCYEENATRARSDWSPPNRNGLFISRGRAKLLATVSPELTSNDRIIWARFGGNNNDFRVVGIQKNDGTFFYDEFTDDVIAQNEKAFFDKNKPFAILDKQRSGTCSVTGNKVLRVSGDIFNTNWARGSVIIIDNIPTILYTSPTDSSHLEIEKDLGAKTGVNWYMPDALLVGQPLPIIFGPFGQGQTGLIIFGLGDTNAAGKLYWLDGNSPDTQSQNNYLEITSPSEPLMNGVMYDGVPFVWTTERSYMIIPSIVDGELSFSARENANSRGLFARYAICTGNDFIYYLSKDGIYKVQGVGNPVSITDDDLYNLFPHSGLNPSNIILPDGTIVYPPDYASLDDMWLFYANKYLIFRYRNTNNDYVALIYDTVLEGWVSYDTYDSFSVGTYYAEEGDKSYSVLVGGVGGKIYQFSDVGIDAEITTIPKTKIIVPSNNMGDSRIVKEFSDVMLDVDLGISIIDGVTVSTYLDNYKTFGENKNIVSPDGVPRRVQEIIDLNNGNGFQSNNIGLQLEWSIGKQIKAYEIQPSFLIKAEVLDKRILDWDDGGILGEKFWQGVILEANTYNVEKTFNIIDDENINRGTIKIKHNGQSTKAYSFDIPFIAHKIKLVPLNTEDINWQYFQHLYKFDKESEIVKSWETQETSHDLQSFQQLSSVFIALSSSNDVDLDIIIDGEIQTYKIPSTNNKHLKIEIKVKALKGKLYKYRLSSESGFRLYKRECEVLAKSCNNSDDFVVKNPFGENTSLVGAEI